MKTTVQLPPYLVELIGKFKKVSDEYNEIDTDDVLSLSKEDIDKSEELNEVQMRLAYQIALGVTSALEEEPENELLKTPDWASKSQRD